MSLLRLKRLSIDRLMDVFALVGGMLYLVQSWIYAHTQASLLDEGAYLLKGYLFTSGKYWPYQDYGPWTNHTPLSFLIPGWIELLFCPGLRTGRYFAVFLGLLTLLGLWLVARRLGSHSWAALTVWTIALDPAIVKLYSLANSEVLGVCMLVWVLGLAMKNPSEDENVPPLAIAHWQRMPRGEAGGILAGAFLAGLMVVTRVNLSFVLPFLVLYLAWEYGWRVGLLAAAVGALPVVIVHAIFWPDVLRAWAHWLPLELFTFLKGWGHPPGAAPSWNPAIPLAGRLVSLFHGFRFHFVALMGASSAWLLWPRRRTWKTTRQFRMAVFLSVLFVAMTLAHLWAALGNNYCVYCFPVYLSFFSPLGLILVVVTFSLWERQLPFWRKGVIALSMLVLTTGLGYGLSEDVGNTFLPLLKLDVPRFKDLHILPGSVKLWKLLEDCLGMSLLELEQLTRRLLPTLSGLLVGLLLLVAAALIARCIAHRAAAPKLSFGTVAILLYLCLGFLLSPTIILGGGYRTYDCGGDVLRGYETVGAHLSQLIPPGSLVYWEGDPATPLLYLPDVRLFPAQINAGYSFRLGGEPDALARYGFWNETLARRWAEQADYLLIEERQFGGWLGELVSTPAFDELPPAPSPLPCREKARIHVYRKIR